MQLDTDKPTPIFERLRKNEVSELSDKRETHLDL